jgi:hypothetical protein
MRAMQGSYVNAAPQVQRHGVVSSNVERTFLELWRSGQ